MRANQTPTQSIRYTPRDLDILDALSDYRFLSVPQIQALFFPTKGTAETRLRQLYQHGLVVRLFVAARPYDRRVYTIYGLSAKGAKLLRERHQGVIPPFLSPKKERSALFLDHTLRRNDLRICLNLLTQKYPDFKLVRWQQSTEEVKTQTEVAKGRDTERVAIIPDAVFTVARGKAQTTFAVEIDMGTVRLTAMAERYRAYWSWWKTGGPAKRFGPMPFHVLTLTTSDRHLQALRKAAMDAPTHGRKGSGLFWFTLLSALDLQHPEQVLGPIWQVAQQDPKKKLQAV